MLFLLSQLIEEVVLGQECGVGILMQSFPVIHDILVANQCDPESYKLIQSD
jgi:hypothetical protein